MDNENDKEANDIVSGLLNEGISKENYGSVELYKNHLFEQYKIYLEFADRISERRNRANAFFLSLHSLFLTGLGLAIGYSKQLNFEPRWMIFFMTTITLLLCYFWWRTIKSYRQLNTAKFKVIGQFEKSLPASPYWSAEWESLEKGKNKKLYWPISSLENVIPPFFAIIYILGSIWFLLA